MPEVSKHAKVYAGEDITVTIVRIGKLKENRVLIHFAGIDHPWDDKVVEHQLVTSEGKSGKREEYRIKHDGSQWTTMSVDEQNWSTKVSLPYLKDTDTGIARFEVYRNKQAEEKVKPEAIVEKWIAQKAGSKGKRKKK